MKANRILAAKISIVVALSTGVAAPAQATGIPVFDATNVIQTTISAMKQVAAVQTQIQQYQTQLLQYENMLKNSLAPAAWVWDQANTTIKSLLNAQNTLAQYKQQMGSIDNYLSKFQDVNYYKTSPCFSGTGCTAAQRQALFDAQAQGSQAVKKANDAVLKTVDEQQQTLQTDADNLRRLQTQAMGATGQMEAIQAGAQLASAEVNQLLQIRGLLVAQNQAAAIQIQVQNDRSAQEAAATQAAIGNNRVTFDQSKNWKF